MATTKKWGGRTRWGIGHRGGITAHLYTESETRGSDGAIIWSGWLSACGLSAVVGHDVPLEQAPERLRKCQRCLAKE